MASSRLLAQGAFTLFIGVVGASACGDSDQPGPSGTGGRDGGTGGRTSTGGRSGSGGGSSSGGAVVEPDASSGGSGGLPAEECVRATMPTRDDRPETSDDGDALPPITLALFRVLHGGARADAAITPDPDAWRDIGFDADRACTRSLTCQGEGGARDERSCRNEATTAVDGNGCRDNVVGRLFGTLEQAGLKDLFGLSEQDWNCELHRGGFSTLIRVSDYNGKANDAEVRVDLYTSPGLKEAPSWKCRERIDTPLEEDWQGRHTAWSATAHWKVARRSLDPAHSADDGALPHSSTFDERAFVRDGILVAELTDGGELWHYGAEAAVPGFRLQMRRPVLVAPIVQDPANGQWLTGPSLLVFGTTPEALVTSFREVGVCENACGAYDSLVGFASSQSDVLAGFANDPEAQCSVLSGAIGFAARQAMADATDIVDVAEPVQCPPPRHPRAPRHGCTCVAGECVNPEGGIVTDGGVRPDGDASTDAGSIIDASQTP